MEGAGFTWVAGTGPVSQLMEPTQNFYLEVVTLSRLIRR